MKLLRLMVAPLFNQVFNKVFKRVFSLLSAYAMMLLLISVLAPVAAALQLSALYDAAHSLLGFSCQQVPGRSFWLFGYPMAVCARCVGIYFGVAFATFLRVPVWLGVLALLEKPLEWAWPWLAACGLPQNGIRCLSAALAAVFIIQYSLYVLGVLRNALPKRL